MNTSYLFIILLLASAGLVASQPVPKTSWMQVNELPISNVITSYPRIATFSTGEYVVVYSVSLGTTNSAEIAAKIYRNPNSIKAPEFILSPMPSTNGPHYAPNVIVLPSDIAVVIWRSSSPQYPIYINQFDRSGNSLFGPYPIPNIGGSALLNTDDILGLISLNSSSVFGFTLPPSTSSSPVVGFANVGQATPPELLNIPTVDIPAGIYDVRSNTSCYVTKSAATTTIQIYNGYKPGTPYSKQFSQSYPTRHTVPFLIDLPFYRGFVHTEKLNQNIRFVLLNEEAGWQSTLTPFNTSTVRNTVRPSVVHLGENYIVVAHSATTTEVMYRYMRITPTRVDYLGPLMAPDGYWSSDGVDMALVQNAITMVALDPEQTQVMARVMSSCGNGILDVNEQCDGGDDCNPDCTCLYGMEYRDGQCIDVCGNGIVTGSEDCDGTIGCNMTLCKCLPGYQPYVFRLQCRLNPVDFVPDVTPSLDCLNFIDSDSMVLYFSYVNNNGFDQTISYGFMNQFSPSELAGDRPTFFKAGSSLNYPVSPYSLTVPRSTTQVTWQLGSYSLNIDLSGDKAQSLQCPQAASFILNVASSYDLTDTDVNNLVENIAEKYNISKTRLSATYKLSANGSDSTPNIYSVSIMIAGSTDNEKSGQEIVMNLYSGLKNSRQELDIDLSAGLTEKNPQIKDVVPGIVIPEDRVDLTPSADLPSNPAGLQNGQPYSRVTNRPSSTNLPFDFGPESEPLAASASTISQSWIFLLLSFIQIITIIS